MTGIDPIDEQDVVHEPVEPACFTVNDGRVFGDGRIGTVAGQELAVANDGRQRRAELVADRREEAGLAQIEPLQLGNGRLLRLESGFRSQLGVLAVGDVPQVEQLPADAGILE